MGLISRVSSRTYRRRKIYIMPDQAVADNSRSASYAKKVLYKRKRWTTSGEKKAAEKTGQVGRAQRFYPVDQERRRFKTTGAGKSYRATQKLREGIVPGSVLILVAGKHKGKRVVFLKQLESGLLLVSGPFCINGCPLRRINQIYVIATKTKLDISGVQVPEKLNDAYYRRQQLKKPKQGEGEIFDTKKEEYVVSEERKADQLEVDKQLLEVIRAHEDKKLMFGYLKTMFSLKNHQYPHKMMF